MPFICLLLRDLVMAFSIGREKISQELEVKSIGKIEQGFGPIWSCCHSCNFLSS